MQAHYNCLYLFKIYIRIRVYIIYTLRMSFASNIYQSDNTPTLRERIREKEICHIQVPRL